MMSADLGDSREKYTSSPTLQDVIESVIKKGTRVKCQLRGSNRRRVNQMLCETVSVEQVWACPSCYDADRYPK